MSKLNAKKISVVDGRHYIIFSRWTDNVLPQGKDKEYCCDFVLLKIGLQLQQ